MVCECAITSCPFAFTEESEQIQNYACLPTPHEIIQMRQQYGKTWACHSDTTKPCVGAIKSMKNQGMEYSVIDSNYLTEQSDWHLFIGES